MLRPDFSPFPELVTGRLLLRDMRLSDAEAVFAIRQDSAHPRTRIEVIEILERVRRDVAQNRMISWSVVLKDNNAMIGEMAFWRIDAEHHRAEIGYSFRKDFQRKGYATEALGAVLQYGFDQMKLHSVEGNCGPENAASIALLKKHGFQQEGYLRENYFQNGKFRDTMRFSLLTNRR